MAEQQIEGYGKEGSTPKAPVETGERGLFDCFGKKEAKKQDDIMDDVMIEVDDPENVAAQKEKKVAELHRTRSHSSSSSEEEVEGEGGERKKMKKKGLKEKIKDKLSGEKEETEIPVDIHDELGSKEKAPNSEEKKGFLNKIKEKLPGHHKKAGENSPPENCPPDGHFPVGEKKGILEKIKEKLHKNSEDGLQKAKDN